MNRRLVGVLVVAALAACKLAVPGKPQQLTAALDALQQHVVLQWMSSGPIKDISIYRSETSHGQTQDSVIMTLDGSVTSWTDSSVIAGHSYYYVIAFRGDGGYGPLSDEVAATIPGRCSAAPPAPVQQAPAASGTAVTLSWTAVSNSPNCSSLAYRVSRGTTAGGPYPTTLGNFAATTMTDSTVAAGNKYFYVVASDNEFGYSANSNEQSATIGPPPPSITSPSSGTSTTNGNVTVSGTANANASVTVLDGTTTAATVTANASGAFSTSVTLAIGAHSLTARQTVNSVTSAASAAVSITVAPPAPAITSPTSGTSTTNPVTVSGTANASASVSILDGSTTVATTAASSTGSFSVSISLAGGTHSLTATQTVSGATSAASAAVSITVTVPPCPATPTQVAGTLWGPSGLGLAGSKLYFSTALPPSAGNCYSATGSGDAVMSVPIDGSAAPVKVDDIDHYAGNCGVYGMAADTTYLYWLNYADATIKRRRLDLTDTATALYNGGQYGNAMVIQPNYANLYWHLYGADYVNRSPIPTAGTTNQFTQTESGYQSVGLAIDSNNLYYTDNYYQTPTAGFVYSVSLGATTLPASRTTLASSQYAPHSPAVGPTTLYWLNAATSANTDGALMQVPLPSGTVTTLAGSLLTPGRLVIDSTNAYVLTSGTPTTYTDGKIYKIPLAGGTPTVLIQNLNYPTDIALDASCVYWSTNNTSGTQNGTIMRMAK